jgi:putative DNA primase/helicase
LISSDGPSVKMPPKLRLVKPGQVDLAAPLEVARSYVRSRIEEELEAETPASAAPTPDLRHWQHAFWEWKGSHYEELSDDDLQSALYFWLEQMKNAKDEEPVKPTEAMVKRVTHALRAAAQVANIADTPTWLGSAPHPPEDIIACQNGLLHVPTRTLLPPSRSFFNFNAVSFAFDAEAPAPAAWLGFLRSVWGDDAASIQTLQELFGLALTSDTSFQKAFLLIGPKRSGKGTIARVLTALVGQKNIVAPMLASLGQQFGLESMIGKTVALVSDARLGGRADIAAIVENILRISGEDSISVPRKHKSDWTATLKVRFVILSNELPAFLDQSGALSGRFVFLKMKESFYGKEDITLTTKLKAEMPGILLWALAGLDRLRARGAFEQPESAREMVEQLELIASPIKAFVADRCVVRPGVRIDMRELFSAWVSWCDEQGREGSGTAPMFGRNLLAAFPAIGTTRPYVDGKRALFYEGIRLRLLSDPEEVTP